MSELPAVSVSPAPTDEEMAAIAAAYQALWPQPSEAVTNTPVSTAWRFSGRWFKTPTFPAR